MAPQPRVAVHYSMEQPSPRALKAIASTHSPMYKPCMDAKCALALHMYRRGKTLPQWLSQTCCAAEPNYYRFLSQSQNTKTISFQYKTLLDTLSSSVDRVAAQCQETKVEWVQNKQTKEKKNINMLWPYLWGCKYGCSEIGDVQCPSQLLSSLDETEGWIERDQSQAAARSKRASL